MRSALLRSAIMFQLLVAACSSSSPQTENPWHPPVPIAVPTPECEPSSQPPEVAVFPYRIDLAPGETATVDVRVIRNGYCGPIDAVLDGLPETVQYEVTSVSWPADVAIVRLAAADTLTDDIRIITVRAVTDRERWFEFRLRTRATAETAWSDEVVGMRGTQFMGDPTWVDGSRVVFADYEFNSPGETTPVIRCIELGMGPCADFGESGSVPLEPRAGGFGDVTLARASDGSMIVVRAGPAGPARTTEWRRLTRNGDWVPVPAIASAATNSLASAAVVDSLDRILFLAWPDGSPFSSELVRLKPDGSLDESFGDGGSVPSNAAHRIHLIPDGRIVLEGFSGFVWLDHDGTRIGAPVHLGGGRTSRALPDGAMIYGEITPEGEPDEAGSVTIVEADGTVRKRWELGLGIEPDCLFIDDEGPLVVAGPVYGQRDLRLLRLPLDGEPFVIAERRLGATAGCAALIESGALFVLGGRAFMLPDSVWWEEAFVWRVE